MTKKTLIKLMKALNIEFIEPENKSPDLMKHSFISNYKLIAKRGMFITLNKKLGKQISKLWKK